jgi:hypothetical protein
MRRIASLVLLALGVALIVAAPMLRFYVYPNLAKTPINQYAESIAPGTGTVFDPVTLTERHDVALVAHRRLRGDVVASSDNVGVWDESVVLSDGSGKMVNTTVDRVAWDRKTAEAVNCCGEAVDGVPTKHKGLSYKFPFNTKKTTYQFFDTTAKAASAMVYKSQERIKGLTVYRFQQRVEPVQIGVLEVPGNLVGSTEASVVSPRFYDNTRTVWVEPRTGVIIKGQEQQHQVLRDASGADKTTLVGVTLTFNDLTQTRQANLAKKGIRDIRNASLYGPLAALIVGLILTGLGAALLRRRDAA